MATNGMELLSLFLRVVVHVSDPAENKCFSITLLLSFFSLVCPAGSLGPRGASVSHLFPVVQSHGSQFGLVTAELLGVGT